MWKSVFKHTNEFERDVGDPLLGVEVTKDFRRGKAVYSYRLGTVKVDGTLSPFIDPVAASPMHLAMLATAAKKFVEEDILADAENEKKRLAEIAGKGKSKNPLVGTGLSRFKKKSAA